MLTLWLVGCRAPSDDSGGTPVDGPAGDPAPAGPPWLIPLDGCYFYRTAEVTVGEQAFHLSIDSGSATMAVASDDCADCDGTSALYETGHGEETAHTASSRYDDGGMGWDGDVYKDTVTMGGIEPVLMRFAAVTDQDYMFGTFPCDSHDVPVDGILGLRQDRTLRQWTDSYLSETVEHADVPDAFALHLCHEGGTLQLGGYDALETTGDMQYLPFASDTSYSVDVRAFEVVSQTGDTTPALVDEAGDTMPGLLDSGGPHLLVPPATFEVIVDAIAADPAFSALGTRDWWEGDWWESGTVTSASPDELDAVLPTLRIDLDSVQLDLRASESYLLWEEQPSGEYAYWPKLIAYDFLDLGNLPMFGYVVYTDRAAEQIGFAPAASCP